MDPNDSIVISGISGRYPESNNVEEFTESLLKGINLVTVDDRRYPVGCLNTPHGTGKVPEIDKFDASFFGVHPKQANYMDPRQRILNEVIYESLIDSGYNPKELRGSRTGVYVGLSTFSSLEELRKEKTDGYTNIGICLGQAANRPSYCFDFHGPSYSMDTACSSAMYAMVNAVKDMKMGLTDSAVVCGSQLVFHPHETAEFNNLNMLAADSKCKVFCRQRDGYARSEAVVSIFLQKGSDSRRVYATIVGAGCNTDGYKMEGITYPSYVPQLQLMKEVYANAGVDPNEVVYIETHGTGTPAGDSQELLGLVEMFCKNRKTPLAMGAVKSNMGHSETSSALCSITKVLAAMETGIISANLHTDDLDTELPGIKEGTLKVVTENLPWNGGTVALNSFGFGGANAHTILRSNQKEKSNNYKKPTYRLVQVSGRTEEAVKHFLDGVEKRQDDVEFLALVDEIHKMNVEGHNFRGYTILGDKPRREIERYNQERPIWFIYAGMGSQWVGVGRDLMKIAVFRDTIKKCATALKPYNIDLEYILTTTTPDVFDNIMNSFCAIGAVEIALTDVLHSLGIFPDHIAGHSLGEVGCAYADGQITAEQAVLLAYARGHGTQAVKIPPGLMAAIGLSKEECEKYLPEDVFVACHNGKNSVTITGPIESTSAVVDKLTSKGIFARKVQSGGIAFHSKYVADAAPLLYDFVKKVLPNPKPRSKKWITTSVPEHKKQEPWAQYNCAEYHRNNFCSQVLFNDIYPLVPENAIVIEVAPHGLLQAILKREMGLNVSHIPLVNRSSEDNELFFLSSIGKIFLAGGQPNLRKLYPGVSFPVSRGTKMIAPLIQWDHSVSWFVPLFRNQDSFGEVVTVNLADEEFAHLEGHSIDGRVLMPATGYLDLVWKVFATMHLKSTTNLPVVMENIKFKRATVLPSNGDVKFLVNIMKQSGNFEIFEGGSIVTTGKISSPKDIKAEFTNPDPPKVPPHNYLPLQKEDLYRECRLRRYMYNGLFQGIKECDVYGAQGSIEWHGKFDSFFDTMLHLSLVENVDRELHLPTSIEKIIIDPAEHLKLVSEHKVLPVFYNQSLNTIKCGSVEIIGTETSIAPRRHQTQEDPVLESYEFVPYENSIKTRLDFTTSLSISLQIIIQNSIGLIKSVKISLVSDKTDLAESIKKVLNTQALVKAEFSKYNPSNKNEHFDALVLTTDDVDDLDIDLVLRNLSKHGFVLYLGDFLKIQKAGLQIVYQAVTTESNVYLLRPFYDFPKNYGVVNVRNTDFDWVKKVQNLIKTKAETIYLFSQDEDLSGILGLVRCLLAEPNTVKFRSVFIEKTNIGMFSIDEEFYQEQLSKDLTFNVFKNGSWGTFVHLPLKPLERRDVTDASITILIPGDLSTLTWVERWPEYAQLDSRSELVYVYYSSLNFKDVMLATGKLQTARSKEPTAPELMIGFEYSGVTSSGKRVMGLVECESLSLQVKNDWNFTWEVPDTWSLEEAATVPCVYATCYYAMIMRGQMRPGESVLIHAGTGGIGMAAISIALSMGCTVYTTVSTPEKKAFIKTMFSQLKDENIGNSRNASFRKMVMQNTNRRGVDLILNSLSAELFQESLKCIAVRGRFLEIGKVDFFNSTPIDSKMFLKNCSFHGVLLDDFFGNQSEVKDTLRRLVKEGIKSGAVRPLPRTVYDDTEVENAFRFLSSGKHKGKVLIRIRNEDNTSHPQRTITAVPKVFFSSRKSYIVTGGLGGLGLELTEWMIRKGAKHIVLNSRRGVSNGYQSYCLKKWGRFHGINVKLNVDDTTSLEGARKLVDEAQKLGPLGGVFNLAAQARDALIENQTKEMFEEVFKSKIISGRNLDVVTRKLCPELDYFVVFSSEASGRGNSGQTNYGMANSALERLCEKRRRENLPGLAIQWGPMADVGMVVNLGVQEKIFDQKPQDIYSFLNTLERFMLQESPVVSSVVLAKEEDSSKGSSKTPAEAIAHVLGISNIDLIEKNITLSQLGLDSLMVAEIKQTLYRNYQLEVSVEDIRDMTFENLIQMGGSNFNDDTKQSLVNGNGIINEQLANVLSKEAVVELHRSKGNKNVFLVHPIEGHVEMLRDIAEQLNFNVFGLQSTKDANFDTVQDYASYYLKEIKSKQPNGPYLLCGYSYGALVAFDMGLQLEKKGEKAEVVSIEGSPAYVKSTLEGGFVRHGKSMDKSQAAILTNFAISFSPHNRDKVSALLENTAGWEKQLKIISELLAKETGLDAADIAVSADRFYKRCHAGYFYEPRGTLSGKLVLIRREDNEYILSDDYEFHKICKKPVEVLKLAGDHRSILLGENIKKIAGRINSISLQ